MAENNVQQKKKFSELTLEDKEYETMDMIHTFSKDIIPQIDKAIGGKRPPLLKAPFLDLLVESYFSIQAFCVLVKEGLISSSAAILRVMLEQVSIIKILSENPLARKSFEGLKLLKYRYKGSDLKNREIILNSVKKLTNKKRINQFFDYGWYKFANCKDASFKSICEVAGTSKVYEMVDIFLNQFSHGQQSIFQFRRAKPGLDMLFISSMIDHLFQLFTLLVGSTVKEFGEVVVPKEMIQSFDLIRSLIFDIKTRISESRLKTLILSKKEINYSIASFKEVAFNSADFLDLAKDHRILYFQTQAYIRAARCAIIISVLNNNKDYTVEDFKDLKLANLIGKYQLPFSSYNQTDVLPLESLLKMIDSIDDDFTFAGHPLEYDFTYSINTLLSLL